MTRVGYCLFPRRPRTGLVAAAIAGLLAGGLLALPAGVHQQPMPAARLAAAAGTTSGMASSGVASATPNGLAATPSMGWNDWYAFHCGVNAQLVEQSAQAMVSSGMAATGTWADNPTLKSATFPAQTARYIRLTALAGHNGYASAAENQCPWHPEFVMGIP